MAYAHINELVPESINPAISVEIDERGGSGLGIRARSQERRPQRAVRLLQLYPYRRALEAREAGAGVDDAIQATIGVDIGKRDCEHMRVRERCLGCKVTIAEAEHLRRHRRVVE